MKMGFKFPEARNAFVLDHQRGRRDVTCKPAVMKDLKLSIKLQERYFQTFEGKLRKNCFINTNINEVSVEPSFNVGHTIHLTYKLSAKESKTKFLDFTDIPRRAMG